MDTSYHTSDSAITPVSNLFKTLSTSKPIYTIHWIKYQVSLIDEHTPISELAELLQHATLTLLVPGMSNKQIVKAKRYMSMIAIALSCKAGAIDD